MGCFVEPMTKEESEGLATLRKFVYFKNSQDYQKVFHENLELATLFKPKIDELVEKRNKSKPEEKSKRKLL